MHQLHESRLWDPQAKGYLRHNIEMYEFKIKLSRAPSDILKYVLVPFLPKKPQYFTSKSKPKSVKK